MSAITAAVAARWASVRGSELSNPMCLQHEEGSPTITNVLPCLNAASCHDEYQAERGLIHTRRCFLRPGFNFVGLRACNQHYAIQAGLRIAQASPGGPTIGHFRQAAVNTVATAWSGSSCSATVTCTGGCTDHSATPLGSFLIAAAVVHFKPRSPMRYLLCLALYWTLQALTTYQGVRER